MRISGADDPVQLRQLFQQLPLIALGKASGGNQHLARPGLFEVAVFDDGVDGFLLGLFDESAGVDDDDLGMFGIRGELKAAFGQRAQHDLAVYLVFAATKIDEPDRSFQGLGGKDGRGHEALSVWDESNSCQQNS